MHQINFTWNLYLAESTTMFFFIQEANKTILDFTQGTARVLQIYFDLV